MLVLEWKEIAFIQKANSRCFCWFAVHRYRLRTNLQKGAWNVALTNSETVGHKDLKLGKIVYILVVYNVSFSWLPPLDGFQFHFCCVTVKTIHTTERECHVCVTQNRKCNTLQTESWLNNLSRPKQSFKTIPTWNYPVLGRLICFLTF